MVNGEKTFMGGRSERSRDIARQRVKSSGDLPVDSLGMIVLDLEL